MTDAEIDKFLDEHIEELAEQQAEWIMSTYLGLPKEGVQDTERRKP